MKTVSLPVFRPRKFGASATEIGTATDELSARITKRLQNARVADAVNPPPAVSVRNENMTVSDSDAAVRSDDSGADSAR